MLTREAILERVWLDAESISNTVDVCVGTLRKKVDAPLPTKLIQTVHRHRVYPAPAAEGEAA